MNYKIKILGVGGGGSNTVDYIVDSGTIEDVETYAINTDAQALENSKAEKKIHIGKELTKGLGAGAIPSIGKKAAEESIDEIVAELRGADIVFIASGMGGGTGTGAAPFVAEISKKLGILTIAVVTKPFDFEGPTRMQMALDGIKALEKVTDVTIVIPNERLIENHDDKYIEDAFMLPDEVLKTATESIVQTLEATSTIGMNIDLNTLKNTLKEQGLAVMGIGESNNPELSEVENLIQAIDNAVDSNILEISIYGAKKILLLVGGNLNYLTPRQIQEVNDYLYSVLNYEFQIATGFKDYPEAEQFYRSITLIATGYDDPELTEKIVTNSKNSKPSANLFVGL